MGEGAHGKTVEGIKTLGGLFEGYVMCPDCRGIRNRRAHYARINPLGNVRPRAPVAPSSRKQGIKEAFGFDIF